MVHKLKILVLILLFLDIARIIYLAASQHNFQVLNPQGIIAFDERSLMLTAILIMLFAAIPILFMTFFFGWKYRENNHKSNYTPDWDHDTKLQTFWWAFAISMIIVLSTIDWIFTHRLDPKIAIASTNKPMVIQVVAMRWKWLFIYPDQNIATVNFVEFPEQTPINFELTGYDSPMNSFWIPQLGGQIYAMSGMATQIHLMASSTGEYRGSSSEISGQGFSGMRFTAKSVTQSDFNNWVSQVKSSSLKLDETGFNQLAIPSENNPISFYSSTEPNLYTKIVTKYMSIPSPTPSMNSNQTMNQMQGM